LIVFRVLVFLVSFDLFQNLQILWLLPLPSSSNLESDISSGFGLNRVGLGINIAFNLFFMYTNSPLLMLNLPFFHPHPEDPFLFLFLSIILWCVVIYFWVFFLFWWAIDALSILIRWCLPFFNSSSTMHSSISGCLSNISDDWNWFLWEIKIYVVVFFCHPLL